MSGVDRRTCFKQPNGNKVSATKTRSSGHYVHEESRYLQGIRQGHAVNRQVSQTTLRAYEADLCKTSPSSAHITTLRSSLPETIRN